MFFGSIFFRYSLSLILLSVLPFFILVRGALYFYQLGITGYIALLLSSLLASLLIVTYLVLIDRWLSEKVLVPLKFKFAIVFTLVIVLNVFSIMFFSHENSKTTKINQQFTSLHPLLRIGVSLLTFTDPDLVVTSIKRNLNDYKKMGLDPIHNSKHFRQKDGYVHAVDIRTNSNWFLRNWFNRMMFNTMGFVTLRHNGTADHLHVSLPVTRQSL